MIRGIDLQGGDRLADVDGDPTGLSYAAFEASMLASKPGRAMRAGSNRLHLAACHRAHDSRHQGEARSVDEDPSSEMTCRRSTRGTQRGRGAGGRNQPAVSTITQILKRLATKDVSDGLTDW